MKQNYKYDPEDLESLLLHKQFHELYPEEKEFVLRHIDTPEEYESMRQTLFELRDAASQGDWLQPDASIKKALLAEFSSEQKGLFRVWLNSLFTWPDVRWYRQPVLQLAMVVLVITTGVWLLMSSGEQQQLIAEVKTKSSEESIATTTPLDTVKKEDNVFAENKMPQEFPVAPEPVKAVPVPMTTIREVQTDDVKALEEPRSEKVLAMETEVEQFTETAAPAAPPQAQQKEAATVVRNADMTLAEVTMNKSQNKSSSLTTNSKPVSEVKDLLAFLYTAQ
jgi:hypothetical protein